MSAFNWLANVVPGAFQAAPEVQQTMPDPAALAALGKPLIEGWMPPTKENYDLIVKVAQIAFPVIGSAQWLIKWYGMGKTSAPSILNIPGRLAWLTMESPGFLTLLYLMRQLPLRNGITDLPWQNRVLAGLFVIHYTYRAVAFPFLQPSIAPIHVSVWALAVFFQVTNAISLGGWFGAYGVVTEQGWRDTCSVPQFVLGITVFYVGLAANFFHDEELREIRRRENRRQERIRKEQGLNGSANANNNKNNVVSKHYQIPQAGLFKYMLFPHYFCEWVEWFGYWMAAGWGCTPARTFLVNELFTMIPRAVRGKKWYVEKFGEEKVGKKWAAIPGIW